MTPTRVLGLVAWAAGVFAVGWGLLAILATRGVHMAPVGMIVVAVEIFLAAIVFTFGWAVRSYVKGNRPNLSGIQAARFIMLGKAASHAGAMLAGWYGAQVALAVPLLQFEPQQERALGAGLAVLGAIVLAVVGYMTEKFGRIPPSDGTDLQDSEGGADPSGQSA